VGITIQTQPQMNHTYISRDTYKHQIKQKDALRLSVIKNLKKTTIIYIKKIMYRCTLKFRFLDLVINI